VGTSSAVASLAVTEEKKLPAHRFLRAYMAGVVAPTIVVCAAAIVVGLRFDRVNASVERAMIFPMAINPLAWGLWNALYVTKHLSRRISLGSYGALLSVLLIAAGVALAHMLGLPFVTTKGGLEVLPPTALAYFVLWKYVVGFFNRVVGLPD
jgi:hypothetical protein